MSGTPEITALILAAGRGSRMGGGKLLLPLRGTPVLRHVVDSVAAMAARPRIFVVTGHESEPVRGALESVPGITFVDNPHWERGQSTSLRAGIDAISEQAETSVMVLLGDQPLVRTDTLERLAEAHSARLPSATAPEYQGRRGNPVILSPCLLPEIRRLEGDTGARGILARLGDQLLMLPVDDPGVVMDIDTPDDYERASDTHAGS